MTRTGLMEQAYDLLTAAGLKVYWPDQLTTASDGTLTPPSDVRFVILWPGDATPHANWTPDAFSMTLWEISAGGASLGDCEIVRETILSTLDPYTFKRVRTVSPSVSNRPGNKIWITALLFRSVINR